MVTKWWLDEVPELRPLVVEPTEGTALDHLKGGLFEAHARDESGYRDEGGHKQMWEAARDLALELAFDDDMLGRGEAASYADRRTYGGHACRVRSCRCRALGKSGDGE